MWVRVTFKVFNMSARESFYTYGVGSPATFLHFCHAFGARANVPVNLNRGIIPFVTYADIVGRKESFEKYVFGKYVFDIPRPANRNKITGIGRTDILRGHMSGGVIFYINGDEQDDLEKLRGTLPVMRFGGGVLISDKNCIMDSSTPEALLRGITGFTPEESSVSTIRQIRTDLLLKKEDPDPDCDFIDLFLHSITPHKSRGWKCPFLAGYRFLETPVKRTEARRITERDVHVFAEPVLGVLKWVPCSKTKKELALRWYINHNESGIRYSNEPNGE
jgi:hypothetical protein